jgi:hypothetical protein
MNLKAPVKCDLCQRAYEYGPPDYRGQRFPHYDLFLCDGCCAQNSEGILRNHERRFIEHLKARNIALPERNEQRLFPRD